MSALVSGPISRAAVAPITDVNVNLVAAPALPSGFPSHLDSELAWTPASLAVAADFILCLNEDDITEVNVAVAHFKTLDQDGDLVEPTNFSLPTLGPKLEKLSREVHNGKGFSVIRGLKPASYPVEDLSLIYLGLSSYIAEQRGRQDKRGNMLVHIVADNSTKLAAEHHRHSNKSITFHHEEAGDVISWLTRSTAATGGKCIISSAYTVYNVLAATRPDIIRTLARSDWPFALPRFQCRPVIFYQDNRLIMNFGRAALLGNEAHPRSQNLPSLTSSQMEALDAIESIARATEMEIQTQAGDIHFINNLAILHRREGFADGPTEKRHLVRMRLRSSREGWTIPTALEHEWERAFKEQGIKNWHLDPMPDFYFPLRSQPN